MKISQTLHHHPDSPQTPEARRNVSKLPICQVKSLKHRGWCAKTLPARVIGLPILYFPRTVLIWTLETVVFRMSPPPKSWANRYGWSPQLQLTFSGLHFTLAQGNVITLPAAWASQALRVAISNLCFTKQSRSSWCPLSFVNNCSSHVCYK